MNKCPFCFSEHIELTEVDGNDGILVCAACLDCGLRGPGVPTPLWDDYCGIGILSLERNAVIDRFDCAVKTADSLAWKLWHDVSSAVWNVWNGERNEQ